MILGIFHTKMPQFSWKSYQQIIGRISVLVNSLFEKSDIAAILPNMMMSSHDLGKRQGGSSYIRTFLLYSDRQRSGSVINREPFSDLSEMQTQCIKK